MSGNSGLLFIISFRIQNKGHGCHGCAKSDKGKGKESVIHFLQIPSEATFLFMVKL